MWKEKRTAERHVIELPIKYRILDNAKQGRSETRNYSSGGLLFLSPESFSVGTYLELSVPTKGRVFVVEGKVVHIEKTQAGDRFQIGVEFIKPNSLFLIKMAEQIHLIDEYRRNLSKQAGHLISEEEAAERWIKEHSQEFSEFYQQ